MDVHTGEPPCTIARATTMSDLATPDQKSVRKEQIEGIQRDQWNAVIPRQASQTLVDGSGYDQAGNGDAPAPGQYSHIAVLVVLVRLLEISTTTVA